MKISLIVAADIRNGIGYEGKIPWHIPADLAHFKSLTMGHYILVGRVTWASIDKPLKGRKVIALTRYPDDCVPKYPVEYIAGNIEQAVVYTRQHNEQELFVIGGSSIYEAAFPLASTIYLTRVERAYKCDKFFMPISQVHWRLVQSERLMHENTPFSFIELERVTPE